jgi:hypothetical protein
LVSFSVNDSSFINRILNREQGAFCEFYFFESAKVVCVLLDGPESVHILGPEEGSPGDTLTLECTTADSNPPVDVWWVVDGRAVQVNPI